MDVVGHAVVVNLLQQLLLPGAQAVEAAGAEQAKKVVPERGQRRTRPAIGDAAAQFVPVSGDDGGSQVAGERGTVFTRIERALRL